MRFVMSYSCGKDSTLALHKMLEKGHTPVCLVVMLKKEDQRSYFHGADREMLKKYEKALGIPLLLCPSKGADYVQAFEEGLAKAKAMGAEAAAFGDMDIEENRSWEEERCRNIGLKALFPLWQQGREGNVEELLRLGYACIIKSINHTLLPEKLLGQQMDWNAVEMMRRAGIDVCGEKGEYHTLVIDGPIFRESLDFKTGGIFRIGDYSVVDVR
ncbi:MAG: diphthine--ammonia ligase [Lachnospiraceae bacterium]|nr:diphthine--ammonia ligase [Lachnospiraceae bacterium]